MLKSNLYLWNMTREKYKEDIRFFADTFSDKIAPAFKNIEEESQKFAEEFWDRIMSQPMSEEQAENFDPADFADMATDLSVDRYLSLNLMRYNAIAMWHATLYQFWEQQIRRFLYDSARPRIQKEFKDFCTHGIDDIKKCLSGYGIDITNYICWDDLNELRLLCNVIKHGDGNSAQKLKKVNSDLFVDSFSESSLLDLYKTTLLEQVLNINEETLKRYGESLVLFWDEFPESAVEP